MILQIDTSSSSSTLSLSNEGKVLFMEESPLAKEEAAWLHPAIQRMTGSAKITMDQLKAVAVVAGPGSYTGLRVGMAAAKGICYALQIPLITVNTLQLMAEALGPLAKENKALICPMIDARRQEVFTALYAPDGREILAPCALILDKTSFEEYISGNRLIFSGSGAAKWQEICHSPNALFTVQPCMAEAFAKISYALFLEKSWSDTVYAEPVYLKEFHTHAKN